MDSTRTLVGSCPKMQKLFGLVARAASTEMPVLVLGETGTGKTMIARMVHSLSARKNGRFLDFNCAELNTSLIESQLYGHARGSFTGAYQQTAGLIEQAQGGTLFLDEIAELPFVMQSKLLKALDERRVRPVGGDRTIAVDCRVVAATNRNLSEEIAKGRFREDLFYRLAGITVFAPPLRERLTDIPELARALVQRELDTLRESHCNTPVTGITPAAIDKLCGYRWPGNVRQLGFVIMRAVALSKNVMIEPDDISFVSPGEEEPFVPGPPLSSPPRRPDSSEFEAIKAVQQESERAFLQRLLEEAGGNISEAARMIGMSRNGLTKKLRKHGLH